MNPSFQISPWNEEFDEVRRQLTSKQEKDIIIALQSLDLNREEVTRLLELYREEEVEFFGTLTAPYWQIVTIPDGTITSVGAGWQVMDYMNEIKMFESQGSKCLVMTAPPSQQVYVQYIREDVIQYLST
jgi:hypothetical protein